MLAQEVKKITLNKSSLSLTIFERKILWDVAIISGGNNDPGVEVSNKEVYGCADVNQQSHRPDDYVNGVQDLYIDVKHICSKEHEFVVQLNIFVMCIQTMFH